MEGLGITVCARRDLHWGLVNDELGICAALLHLRRISVQELGVFHRICEEPLSKL